MMNYNDNLNEFLSCEDFSTTAPENKATMNNTAPNQGKNTQPATATTQNGEITQAQYLQSLKQNDFALLDRLRSEFNPNDYKETELIAGRFPRGGVTVIAGAPDTGKSLTLERLYADLSKGGEIFGGISHEDKPKKSIIITADISSDLILERNDNFNFGIDFNYVELIDADRYEENGITFDLSSDNGRKNIEHLAQEKDLDILILDSLGALNSGKENDNQALIKVFSFLRKIARKYNIALVIVHHIRKRLSNERKNSLELEDIIGGSAISRYCAVAYALEYNDRYGMNVIKTLKFWYKNRPKSIGYKAYDDIYGHSHLDIILDLEKITAATQTTQNTAIKSEWRQLLDAFLQGKGTNGASLKEMTDFLINVGQEINNNTLKSEISRREKVGAIIKLKRGIYALPENEIIQNSEQGNQFNFDEADEISEA